MTPRQDLLAQMETAHRTVATGILLLRDLIEHEGAYTPQAENQYNATLATTIAAAKAAWAAIHYVP